MMQTTEDRCLVIPNRLLATHRRYRVYVMISRIKVGTEVKSV